MAGKQKGKLNVADLDFAKAWNDSKGDAKVTAAALDMTPGNVYTRANKMRKAGVDMVEPAGRKPKDIAALNAALKAMAESKTETQVETPQV